MRFKRSTYLKRHLLVHLPKSNWELVCPTCAKVCAGRRDNFDRHVKACAKNKSSAPDPPQVLSIKRRDRRPVVRLGTEIPVMSSLFLRDGRLWMTSRDKEEFESNFVFKIVGHYAKPIDKGYIFRVKLGVEEGGDRWKVAVRNKDLSSGRDMFEALCDGRTSLSLYLSSSRYHLLIDLAKALVQAYADPARRDRRKEFLVAENLGLVEVCDGTARRFVHVLSTEDGAVLVLNEDGALSA
uniref:C2H2-type domain-containing protein n=1 Tax=Plectus sambesii TaxID=2011161 RepID=A0A914X1P1_9BILA